MDDTSTPIMKYILFFAAIYAAIMIFINLLAYGFNIDIGSGANIAMLLGAGYGAAVKFVQDIKRPPTKNEKRLLSFGCLVSTFIISIAGFAIVILLTLGDEDIAVLKELLNGLSPTTWALILFFVGLLHYLVLNLIFGWGASKYAAKYIPQNEM